MGLEISGEKERRYLRRLLVDDRATTFRGKLADLKNRLTRQANDEYVGKTELAAYLTADSGTSNSHAHRFIRKLDNAGCIEVVGQELTASKPVDVITVDKRKLRQELWNSEMYEQEWRLWRHLINKAGDF